MIVFAAHLFVTRLCAVFFLIVIASAICCSADALAPAAALSAAAAFAAAVQVFVQPHQLPVDVHGLLTFGAGHVCRGG